MGMCSEWHYTTREIGGWRHGNEPVRASCYVSIRQSPSCVMPFWTHAKCLLAFISYLPMWIKAKTHLSKPFLARDFMEGHICRQNKLKFALVFCFELRARAARTCCHCHLAVKNPIHDGKLGQLKLPKHVMNGTTMWSHDTELCTNGVEATKCWVFIAHFSIYSTSRCRCHAGTDIPRLGGDTLQINHVVRTVRHRISIHWKCDAQIQNRQIKSPPALWKHLSFQCLGAIVALNGKSDSMLLEPTKNKLKQWRVIRKVWISAIFPRYFEIITKWMKITDRQICEDQIVTFKQSHILLYQGLLF